MVVESIQVVGFDVKYLPRTSNNIDTLFEDAEVSSFNSEFTVEMYFREIQNILDSASSCTHARKMMQELNFRKCQEMLVPQG